MAKAVEIRSFPKSGVFLLQEDLNKWLADPESIDLTVYEASKNVLFDKEDFPIIYKRQQNGYRPAFYSAGAKLRWFPPDTMVIPLRRRGLGYPF